MKGTHTIERLMIALKWILTVLYTSLEDAVIKKYRDEKAVLLDGISSSQLTVYANKIMFEDQGEPLKSSFVLNDLGVTEEDALIVVVPSVSALVVPKGADGMTTTPLLIEQMKMAMNEVVSTNQLSIQQLITTMKEMQDSSTGMNKYAHSQMNSKNGKRLLEDLNIVVDPVYIEPIEFGKRTPIEGYQWETVETHTLNEVQNRASYRKYIEDNIRDVLQKQNLCVLGVEHEKCLLTKKLPGSTIVLTGSTDLLILNKVAEEDQSSIKFLPNVKMLIEVKKDVKSHTDYQAISELIALDLLVVSEPVMALLTDLNSKWLFFLVHK